jgi:hypothetical protein
LLPVYLHIACCVSKLPNAVSHFPCALCE